MQPNVGTPNFQHLCTVFADAVDAADEVAQVHDVPCSGGNQRKLLGVSAAAAPQGDWGAVARHRHVPALAARSTDVVVVEVPCRPRDERHMLIHQAFKLENARREVCYLLRMANCYDGHGPQPTAMCVACTAIHQGGICEHLCEQLNSNEHRLPSEGISTSVQPRIGPKPCANPAHTSHTSGPYTRHDPPDGTSTKPCEDVPLQLHCRSAAPLVAVRELGTSTHMLAAVEVRMA